MIYRYEDGIEEEGDFDFVIDLFECFPDSIISIEVEKFKNYYDANIVLDPFYVSGDEIKTIITGIDTETKELFIENNVWVLVLRYSTQ